mmetsp:Transcript_6173/g.7787  ORF Transcript_6173/g.7787 Transcript_6173/m.7787 type:complete len:83 (+) Transcript_6173:100-348(+)
MGFISGKGRYRQGRNRSTSGSLNWLKQRVGVFTALVVGSALLYMVVNMESFVLHYFASHLRSRKEQDGSLNTMAFENEQMYP